MKRLGTRNSVTTTKIDTQQHLPAEPLRGRLGRGAGRRGVVESIVA